MDYKKLPFIEKVKTNQKEFGEKVIAIANDLGIQPSWLMIVMNNESGLNHQIKNPYGSATGLIQFTEATAKYLGTTTTALRQMTNLEQLDFVKLYFTKSNYYKKIKSLPDTYLAVFFPKALFENDDYVFPKWASDANPIFDINKDKTLTKKEFGEYVMKKYGAYIPVTETEEFQTKKKSKIIIIIVCVVLVIVVLGVTIYLQRKK